ncbi:penicillin-binding protein [Nocardioides panacisoli]
MSRTRPDRLPARKVVSHLGVMLLVSVVLGVVVSGLAIPFAGVLGFAARNVSDSVDELPQALKTEQLPQRTLILDKSGAEIATIYDQNRVNVSLVNISRIMAKAIVSIEDYRFYEHGALDLKGTLRALFTNQASNGVVQGGSSITQQLVKLTLQNQALLKGDKKAVEEATADTYARKLRELRYAIALEKAHSKDWILERYLNTAYFGDSAYGIQAAAQHYFGVNAKDLDLRQSAMLAGLVQSPEAFNPTENPQAARNRRDVVLDRMAQLQVISDRKAARTKKEGLGLDVQPMSNGCVSSRAPFFCDYVISYLRQDPDLGPTPKARMRLLRGGGLTITTTIDTRMQDAAQRAVAAHVYPKDGAIGAIALVQPGTGEVKALAQSRPMGTDAADGQTFLNYTVPEKYGDAAGFQPGSTFKAFVLASAIDQGIPLTTRIPSPSERAFDLGTFNTCDGPYPSSEVYTFHNSTNGPPDPNLYEGTRESINTFFVALEQRTGICEPWKLANAMGIELDKKWEVPSFTLGVADVSPLDMAGAYATFAARGLHCDSHPVTKIEDSEGNLLKEYKPHCAQVIPGDVADAVSNVLEGVTGPGGFGEALAPPQPSAGKTGTTSDNQSVWFVGYTPNMAGAATVAGVNSVGHPVTLNYQTVGGSTIYEAFGSTVAGPIWGDTFKAIAPILPDEDFQLPDSTTVAGIRVPVPYVSSCSSVDNARSVIEGGGLTAADGGFVDSSCPRGTVSYIYPSGGSSLSPGDTVTYYVSDGSPPPPPPKHHNGGGHKGGGGGHGNHGGGHGHGHH